MADEVKSEAKLEPLAQDAVPPWEEPLDTDSLSETLQVVAGEFAGRPLRIWNDEIAAAIADGWAKRIGDPDPKPPVDDEAREAVLHAAKKAIDRMRSAHPIPPPPTGPAVKGKKEHETRDMQPEKHGQGYQTKGVAPKR